jgi:hypothetical protein
MKVRDHAIAQFNDDEPDDPPGFDDPELEDEDEDDDGDEADDE